MSSAEEVIQELGLEPLPIEGGWYRELRRMGPAVAGNSNSVSELNDWELPRFQAIYYLLRGREPSKWHQTKGTEEILTYIRGNAPMTLHEIDGKGCYKVNIICKKIMKIIKSQYFIFQSK